MKKRFLTWILLIPLWISCMPEEDLPLRSTGSVPEYFIECYCSPGQSILLTASYVIPVTDNIQYDFPAEMDVRVYAPNRMMLYYVFDTEDINDVQCNYQSADTLEYRGQDTIRLDIVTAGKQKITARSAIPSPVSIHSYNITAGEAAIRFYTSPGQQENYYIYTMETMTGSEILEQEVTYLDYSKYHSGQLVEKSIAGTQLETAERVVLTLKRITKENYDYQISLNGANTAIQGSITNPVPLNGNIDGALGIFTCYSEDQKIVYLQ